MLSFVDSVGFCVENWTLGGSGNGFSTLPGIGEIDGSTDVIEFVAELENDSVGSSKDTV